MSQTQEKASFQFNRFYINESYFVFNKEGDYNLTISIKPSGIAFSELNQFHLFLEVEVKDKEEKFVCKVKTTSIFDFPSDADIEQYRSTFFVTNAPAITFPYIRAYIANLTTQSGVINVLLPTLNLSNLAEKLKESIEVK
jgi:preprotein translocase subunit SecB